MILNLKIWSIGKAAFRHYGRSGEAFGARMAVWMMVLVNSASYPPVHYGFNYIPLEHTDECPG